MIKLQNITKTIPHIYSFITKPYTYTYSTSSQFQNKSYYQILGVQRNASYKQIRRQFLKKARQLHPDHNKQEKSQQQFKVLKNAYETLKDPQKRYIYDSGISSENINNQSVYSNWQYGQQAQGKKYYENKWYGYKKSTYEDQRDQYYEAKFMGGDSLYQYRKKWWFRVAGIFIVFGGYFGYDYLVNKNSRIDAQRVHVKNLVEAGMDDKEDKKTRKLNRYINQRYKKHKVQ